MKESIILISGVGQLGSRYLQGLSLCKTPLSIHVHDISAASLHQALARWSDVVGTSTIHTVFLHHTLDDIPDVIDLVIVSTSSNVRPVVMCSISERSQVKSWILEKVLAQSEEELEKMLTVVGNSTAWVNTFRRVVPWHQALMGHLQPGQPIELSVDGNSWGLACNSVHFLDLVAWWTGERLINAQTTQLEDTWTEAKRPGFFEIHGTLVGQFSGGSVARLTANRGDYCYQIGLKQPPLEWLINEETGVATRSDGLEIRGNLPLQSQFTAEVVKSIVNGYGCQLPSLQESISLHKVYINSMLMHWQAHVDPNAVVVPIT